MNAFKIKNVNDKRNYDGATKLPKFETIANLRT